jgi:predicted SprT family Zn-dependent metalloprotease
MKVKELKAILENVNDEVEIEVDTEAALYSVHLVDVTGAYFMKSDDSGLNKDLFIVNLDSSVKTLI